jgi:hypothetical protein
MNIFALDLDPVICAEYHVDKHVVKMISEYAQLLCTTANVLGYETPMKPTHWNHPSRLWVGQSRYNALWLQDLLHALHHEWRYRYNHPETKFHKSFLKWHQFSEQNPLWIDSLPDIPFTSVTLCMPEKYRGDNFVDSYRFFYRHEKAHIHFWKNRRAPYWLDTF